MLSESDRQLLNRTIHRNRCILFLGAGFSADATSRTGENLPTGRGLGGQLWGWLGYEATHGPYDAAASPLDKLFDVARRKKGDKQLREFLEPRLRVAAYPEWYRKVAYPFWNRIYTTNVDDLVERIYADARTIKLKVKRGLVDQYVGRSEALDTLQYVKLNGELTDDLDQLTFGARQFAARAGEYDPWYDHFVRDYSQNCTILVGTEVNEQLFWQAVASRQSRAGAVTEPRVRSFLVSPRISPVVVDSLAEFNVVPVPVPARDFFVWLDEIISPYPAYADVVVHSNPLFAEHASLIAQSGHDPDALRAFLGAVEKVGVPELPKTYRSQFLLGAAPTWEDMALGFDAKREATIGAAQAIEQSLADPPSLNPIVITGHRGAGKSTALMRAAISLSAAGHSVFFAGGEDIPQPHTVARALELLGSRVALVIDDAEWLGYALSDLVLELRKLKTPPLLVLSLRANSLFRLEDEGIVHVPIWMDELTDGDIEALIDLLEQKNMLGHVTGVPRTEIARRFRDRARKQLLVALLEVTTGKDLVLIIEREYSDLADQELRLVYLCACLASAASASLARHQLLAVSEMPPAALLSALDRELRKVLVPTIGPGDRLIPRHQVIAEKVVDRAPKTELATAYKRLLAVLAHDMEPQARQGDGRRWFRLYKQLINHDSIYHRFERNLDEARAIFDSLTHLLHSDSQYWLQYGSLELQYGELENAAVYLASAESLAPDNWHVQHAKGHLLLAQARTAGSLAEALALRRDGEEILRSLIREHGEESAYPWHTLIVHTLHWLDVWMREPNDRRVELERLRELAQEALEVHPRYEQLQDAERRVMRAYLATAQQPS